MEKLWSEVKTLSTKTESRNRRTRFCLYLNFPFLVYKLYLINFAFFRMAVLLYWQMTSAYKFSWNTWRSSQSHHKHRTSFTEIKNKLLKRFFIPPKHYFVTPCVLFFEKKLISWPANKISIRDYEYSIYVFTSKLWNLFLLVQQTCLFLNCSFVFLSNTYLDWERVLLN